MENKDQQIKIDNSKHGGELQIYADNLPYNKERVIGEADFFLKHLAASKFEIGKRLMVLKENESFQTFGKILQDHFGGMSKSTAYNFIAFTKKCIDLPKIKVFGEKNWSNILTLLNSCTAEELKEIEENGINGKVLDEYDAVPARLFKTILKRYEKNMGKVSGKQTVKLEAQNKKLNAENKRLRVHIRIQDRTINGWGEDWDLAVDMIDEARDLISTLSAKRSDCLNDDLREKYIKKFATLKKKLENCISLVEETLK